MWRSAGFLGAETVFGMKISFLMPGCRYTLLRRAGAMVGAPRQTHGLLHPAQRIGRKLQFAIEVDLNGATVCFLLQDTNFQISVFHVGDLFCMEILVLAPGCRYALPVG